MEHYASKEDTIKTLEGLGFIQLPKKEEDSIIFFDSPKNIKDFDMPVIQANIYQCRNGYWCVGLEGGFKAPCIWNGPKADWDKSDTLTDFIEWLDKHHRGWR